MTDENDDESEDFDLEDIHDEATSSPMAGMFGSMTDMLVFGPDVDEEPSQEIKIAVRMMKAGSAMNDFVEYIEEEDIDLEDLDQRTMMEMDYEQKVVIFGFMSMSDSLQRFGEMLEDDDDDNPFKVSDGDDPVY